MPNRIKEETEDVIILDGNPLNILLGLSLILGCYGLYIFYGTSLYIIIGANSLFSILYIIGFIGIIIMLSSVLNNKIIVTIDKKSQRVKIKNIFLRSVNEIPFSDVNGICIEHKTYSDSEAEGKYIAVKLTTIQEKSTIIYNTVDEDAAWKVAKKIENFIPNSPISIIWD